MISFQKKIASPAEICTDKAHFEKLCSEEYINERCVRAAQLKRTAKTMENGSEEQKKLLDEASDLKRSLPVFCFNATFTDGKRQKASARLNGLCTADYDGIQNPMKTLNDLYNKFGGKEQFVEKFKVHLIKYSSAMQGFHIVFEADAEVGNLEDNLRKLDEQLGLTHDANVSQPNSASFATPMFHIDYIDDILFIYNNVEYDEKWGNFYRNGEQAKAAEKQLEQATATVQQNAASEAAKTPESMYFGHSYAEIQERLWEALGGYPSEGNRHNMYMKFFANLRYICDNQPSFMKNVFVKPENALSDKEINSIIDSVCAYKYNLAMPLSMKETLAALGINNNVGALPTDQSEISRMLQEQFMPRFKGLNLPDFLKAVSHGVPEDMSIGMVLASMVMMSTYLTGIQFKHFDSRKSRLTLMMFPTGRAASGKHFFEDLDRLIMDTLRKKDEKGREKEAEYKKKKNLAKNDKDQPDKPEPVIRVVPSTISNAMLTQRLHYAVTETENGKFHLHLYIFDTELATLIRSSKGGSWIMKNDIFCKSFHGELWGNDYKNEDAVNGEVEVHINILITGTDEAFNTFISDKNIRDGLATRVIPYIMPWKPFQMLPEFNERTEEEVAIIKEMVGKVIDFTSPLLVDASKLTKAMYNWCDRTRLLAKETEDFELDDLRKRATLIGERMGVIHAILRDIDNFRNSHELSINDDDIAFAEFCADYVLQSQYAMFASRMKNAREKFEQNLASATLIPDWNYIYNQLPQTFTTNDIATISPSMKMESIQRQCRRWANKGKVIKTTSKQYQKIA